MNTISILELFGLSETEAKVYLKLLELGASSASVISETLSLKRPRVYHAIETLIQKGLAHELGKTKIARFAASPPEQLKLILERRKQEAAGLQNKIDSALPFFPSQNDEMTASPHVEFYKGKEGLKSLAEQVIRCKEKKLLALVPDMSKIHQTFTQEYGEFFLKLKKEAGIETKSIWGSLFGKEHEHYNQHHLYNRQVRLAPKQMKGKYKSVILIWDKNVATISLLPELYGFLVKSFDYSETMKAVWQALWDISKPVKG